MMYGCVPKIDPIGVLPSADGITVIFVFAHFSGAHKGNNCFLHIRWFARPSSLGVSFPQRPRTAISDLRRAMDDARWYRTIWFGAIQEHFGCVFSGKKLCCIHPCILYRKQRCCDWPLQECRGRSVGIPHDLQRRSWSAAELACLGRRWREAGIYGRGWRLLRPRLHGRGRRREPHVAASCATTMHRGESAARVRSVAKSVDR